jgi:hypothetical protein
MSDALTQEAGKSGEKKALIFDVQRFFMNAPWRRFIGCPTPNGKGEAMPDRDGLAQS